MSEEKIKITLNGEEVQVDPGTTLLKAATDQGKDVPIFCYHEGLDESGFCRMCLVEIDTPRGKKLITSCNTPCAEGAVCDTHSPAALKGREAVLEFLLVNHPLDCPECDKAGECMLQDNSFGHGSAHSRADFKDKVIKPRKELGDKIRLYSQRCIACRRCTQFLDQVSGTSELAFHQRGDHQDLDIFPDQPVHNSMAKNIVDICPVGALIDKNFQYTTRQWMMKPVDTVCAGCAKGCAVEADVEDESVKRFKARTDHEVNGHWMCDHGRNVVNILDQNRRMNALNQSQVVSTPEALSEVLRLVDDSTALIVSAFNTNEELEAAQKITGNYLGALVRGDGIKEEFPRFTIPADKNPNRQGVKDTFSVADATFDESQLAKSLQGIQKVLILNATPNYEPAPQLLEALRQVESVILLEAWTSALGEVATVVLPTAAPTEKEGHYVNEQGLKRQLRFCAPPPGDARMDQDYLKEIRKAQVKVGV